MIRIARATEKDAAELAALRTGVAAKLTARYGTGHWSSAVSEKGVLRGIAESAVIVLLDDDVIVATLRLAKKKPWAIDRAYFQKSRNPLYLTDMAVLATRQGEGLGRKCIAAADDYANENSVDAIRLDAYDSPAGAGGFYARCGFNEVGRVEYRRVPLIYYERTLGD